MAHIPRSIVESLFQVAERSPDRTGLSFEGATWSYSDLAALASRWAAAYAAWGVRPDDRVALFLDNGPDFLGSYLGAHLAGAIVVLVNTQYRQVELRHILTDADVRLAIVDRTRRPELARVCGDLADLEAVVVVEDRPGTDNSAEGVTLAPAAELAVSEFLSSAAAFASSLPNSGSTALIAYTSGTTGRSKGAMLSHGNLVANSIAVTGAWHWTGDDRLLLTLPLFHIHGLGVGIHGTLITGSAVDLRRRFDAAEVFDELVRGQVTMFFGVPTMYTRLIAEVRARDRRPPPLRLYVSGSAPLSVQTFREFESLFGQPILERYGMTETVMNLTNPYAGERRPGTVGQPFPGQEARIVDLRTRQLVTDESQGEIQVRGPHVFQGYWRRPDATAEAFDPEGWFNTGDIGWRSADGYYTISGRARELIITGGYNVYPREVEEVLLTHSDIAEAAVFSLPDPDFGEQVVAAVVARPAATGTGPNVNPDDLIALCRDQLASYKKPRQIFFVSSLPRNALGKVQKHLLQAELGRGGPTPVEPRSTPP